MNEDLPDEILDSIQHFQRRTEKAFALEELINERKFPEAIDWDNLPALEDSVKLTIEIAQARYAAGDMSEHELTFHRCYAIECQVHERRWMKGVYDDVLKPISEKMRAVEKSYGLSEDEYWPMSEAPEEYLALSKEYDLAMKKKLLEAFCEFGAEDLKDLFLNDPEKFYMLHDAGRKAIFQKDEKEKLTSIAVYYENEAIAAEQAGAFLAASVMLGSAIETRLIITCLENEKTVRSTLTNLGLTNQVLKSKNPVSWSLETLIKVCISAGWIPNYDTKEFTLSGAKLLIFLKSSRNQVHPRRQLKNKGFLVGREQFKDIKYAHKLLSSTLNWFNTQRQSDI